MGMESKGSSKKLRVAIIHPDLGIGEGEILLLIDFFIQIEIQVSQFRH